MKILAVDTSTPSGSIAFMEKDRVVVEWTLHSATTHNRRLLKSVDQFLHELQWTIDDIGGFCAATGPGSFTGLRIGLTTIKTLAWSLGKPFVGIPTLDALAAPFAFSALPVFCAVNAHKKELFCSVYQPDGRGAQSRLTPYRVVSPEAAAELIKGPTVCCGDGWLLYRDFFIERLADFAVEAPAPFHIIRAGFVADLARKSFIDGQTDDPVTSVPIYVRPSEAEINYPHLSKHLHEDSQK